jgi:hypothetical protein
MAEANLSITGLNLAGTVDVTGFIPDSDRAQPNGIATLGENGLVPFNQLPDLGGNFQPRSTELDALAALQTQPFGRGLLTQSSDAGIVTAISGALKGTAYTPVTYLNGWSAYSTSLRYKKFANGLIHLVGMSYKNSPPSTGLLCKLPAGYAPPFFFHPPMGGLAPSWKSGLLGIDANGEVRYYLSDNSGDSYLAINLVFGAA